MVSLNREDNASSGGGVFFCEPPHESDTNHLLHPILGHENVKKSTPLNTIPAALLILLLSVSLEVIVIAFTLYWRNDQKYDSYFYTLYSHVIYWSFTFVLDFYFKRKHHESRISGYLEFYQKTHHHSRIPFYISSMFSAALLAVEVLFHQKYGDFKPENVTNGVLTPMYYMCLIITLENIFMVPLIISYVYKVSQFNKSQLCPDVQRNEWMASFVEGSYSAGEVGYRERDNHVEDLLEKQADLLRYLKEQNTRLAQKVVILSTQLNERRSTHFA